MHRSMTRRLASCFVGDRLGQPCHLRSQESIILAKSQTGDESDRKHLDTKHGSGRCVEADRSR